ncbi:MAG: AbrB family transcriptional regulator [Rhizobiaceae bacterium]|nr:AbrB family transcriptional regulator [Rhizobiaceae bacterium]
MYRAAALWAASLAAALFGAVLFRWLHLPLAAILGSLCGATLVANLLGSAKGGRAVRRGGQLFVGASVGAVLSPDILGALSELLPLMLCVAVLSNLAGLALAIPLARIAGIDRVTAVLCSLPAGMAEMATLAQELKADEQAVALVHTLRVVMVLLLIPLWLGFVAGAGQPPQPLSGMKGLGEILILALLAAAIAWLATRARIVNAYIIVPMLLCVAVVSAGHVLPPVPPLVLFAAQIAIGTSLGLRFRLDRLRRLPRLALGAFLCGLALIGVAFIGLTALVEHLGDLDHVSAILAVAPGGLGEMIASAGTLGLLAAAVAGFQLARSILTNLCAPPLIRHWAGDQKKP